MNKSDMTLNNLIEKIDVIHQTYIQIQQTVTVKLNIPKFGIEQSNFKKYFQGKKEFFYIKI